MKIFTRASNVINDFWKKLSKQIDFESYYTCGKATRKKYIKKHLQNGDYNSGMTSAT